MNVFVDYDSTLNNMSYSWLNWLNRTYNRAYVTENVTHWEWWNELDVDAFRWFKDQIAFTEIQPLPMSQEFYKYLQENFETFILTSSHPNMLHAKDAHILEHYGKCDVIHHHEKWEYATTDNKVCILIDDRPLNCTKWVEAGGIAFLYNRNGEYLYAETSIEMQGLHKVENYEEIRVILEQLKENLKISKLEENR